MTKLQPRAQDEGVAMMQARGEVMTMTLMCYLGDFFIVLCVRYLVCTAQLVVTVSPSFPLIN